MCVLGNMATFHVVGLSKLTIMVDDLRMTLMSKQCLYVMFSFQLRSLHIVGGWFGCCRIVGNNCTHNSQGTMLMPRTIRSMVKIMKKEHEVNYI